ncbi:TetR family transcriptional regulator [Neiella marina]|uniref:TetR family transcriptional regulator n=1 Tax=Neiella marina TaxID=508461 RepID=A0A8J2XMA1_9GAMM|nr:TetR/AcrR family transcriptional regulator [Neiella marina]GGA76691.1 TetR family transcriptional regulator [Neiella marina]
MNRSEQKRQSILNAAKQEFIENGFAGANMNTVCDKAEVSKRTLYRHFESKELLFEAVLTIEQQQLEALRDYRFEPKVDLRQQLISITQQEAQRLLAPHGTALARMVVMEFFRQPQMAKALSERLYHTHAVTPWLQQAIAAGAIKSVDANDVAEIYMALFNGLFLWPQILQLAQPMAAAELGSKIELVVDTFLNSYGNCESTQ